MNMINMKIKGSSFNKKDQKKKESIRCTSDSLHSLISVHFLGQHLSDPARGRVEFS